MINSLDSMREPRATKTGGPQKDLPIEAPALTLEELNKMTDNFSSKALIDQRGVVLKHIYQIG